MIKRFLRELYLLPRGERRAVVLLSLLLILSVTARIIVQGLPDREPPGMDEFVSQARQILQAKHEADSIRQFAVVQSGQQEIPPLPVSPEPGFAIPESPLQQVDINAADSASLLPLPGIGPVFAGRIVKYRKLLGGFVTIEQLNEVYGLSGETVSMISPLLQVDTSLVRKIGINSASFGELLKHPYLGFEEVKLLMKFREAGGRIGSRAEIREHGLLNDSTLQKINPYLDFGH